MTSAAASSMAAAAPPSAAAMRESAAAQENSAGSGAAGSSSSESPGTALAEVMAEASMPITQPPMPFGVIGGSGDSGRNTVTMRFRYWKVTATPASSAKLPGGGDWTDPGRALDRAQPDISLSWGSARFPTAIPPWSRSGPSSLAAALCIATQYGQVFAAETPAATTSFATRSDSPVTSRVSRSMAQDPASADGAGECRATGGATIPKSRSV